MYNYVAITLKTEKDIYPICDIINSIRVSYQFMKSQQLLGPFSLKTKIREILKLSRLSV